VTLITGLSLASVTFFVLGIVVGVFIGSINERINFCDDNSAPRYIQDDAARAQSCDHPRSSSEIE
jgi:hypothetical protein